MKEAKLYGENLWDKAHITNSVKDGVIKFPTNAAPISRGKVVIEAEDTIGLFRFLGKDSPFARQDYFISCTVTDSRGNSTTKTVSKTLVDYVKLTCNIGGSKPNAQGNFDFTVKGNYFNSTFGTVANTLNVYYRWKSDGDFSAWQPMTATKSGNTYTAVVNITGLDYQTTYTFQAYAVDKIATVYTEETPIKSTPVFDWSKDDFNVNVNLNLKNRTVLRSNGDNNNIILSAEDSTDGIFLRPNGTGSNEGQAYLKPDGELVVSGSIDSTGDIISRSAISGASVKATGALTGGSLSVSGGATVNSLTVGGRTFGANKVLWTGGWLMTAGHTANLSEAISKQPNGIALVFSHYDGTVRDWGWSVHFVPKQLIALKPGCGCAFFNVSLANTNYACGKYLYINDTTITGDDTNSGSGTMNGITYYNSNRVMRYVIGV
jgi:ribosome-associated translation inhibitor RaiA